MSEERQPLDPTRRLLRVFGVSVTNYEERTARLLERAADPSVTLEELADVVAQALQLTVDLDQRLRDITGHVLECQMDTLSRLQEIIEDEAIRWYHYQCTFRTPAGAEALPIRRLPPVSRQLR